MSARACVCVSPAAAGTHCVEQCCPSRDTHGGRREGQRPFSKRDTVLLLYVSPEGDTTGSTNSVIVICQALAIGRESPCARQKRQRDTSARHVSCVSFTTCAGLRLADRKRHEAGAGLSMTHTHSIPGRTALRARPSSTFPGSASVAVHERILSRARVCACASERASDRSIYDSTSFSLTRTLAWMVARQRRQCSRFWLSCKRDMGQRKHKRGSPPANLFQGQLASATSCAIPGRPTPCARLPREGSAMPFVSNSFLFLSSRAVDTTNLYPPGGAGPL